MPHRRRRRAPSRTPPTPPNPPTLPRSTPHPTPIPPTPRPETMGTGPETTPRNPPGHDRVRTTYEPAAGGRDRRRQGRSGKRRTWAGARLRSAHVHVGPHRGR
ncbi:MAG: hypothetical protein GEV03_24210 [Streptosporangiales bacterium]|nr:hypothetical protein [Streptosporangiales bacterium]